jgi:hypothetical protein
VIIYLYMLVCSKPCFTLGRNRGTYVQIQTIEDYDPQRRAMLKHSEPTGAAVFQVPPWLISGFNHSQVSKFTLPSQARSPTPSSLSHVFHCSCPRVSLANIAWLRCVARGTARLARYGNRRAHAVCASLLKARNRTGTLLGY